MDRLHEMEQKSAAEQQSEQQQPPVQSVHFSPLSPITSSPIGALMYSPLDQEVRAVNQLASSEDSNAPRCSSSRSESLVGEMTDEEFELRGRNFHRNQLVGLIDPTLPPAAVAEAAEPELAMHHRHSSSINAGNYLDGQHQQQQSAQEHNLFSVPTSPEMQHSELSVDAAPVSLPASLPSALRNTPPSGAVDAARNSGSRTVTLALPIDALRKHSVGSQGSTPLVAHTPTPTIVNTAGAGFSSASPEDYPPQQQQRIVTYHSDPSDIELASIPEPLGLSSPDFTPMHNPPSSSGCSGSSSPTPAATTRGESISPGGTATAPALMTGSSPAPARISRSTGTSPGCSVRSTTHRRGPSHQGPLHPASTFFTPLQTSSSLIKTSPSHPVRSLQPPRSLQGGGGGGSAIKSPAVALSVSPAPAVITRVKPVQKESSCCTSFCRCSFSRVFAVISVFQVVIACVLVWYLGYLAILRTIDTLSADIRSAVLDSCVAQLNAQFALPYHAVGDVAHLTKLRYGNSWPRTLKEFTNTTGWLTDLSYLTTQYPQLIRLGFVNTQGVLQVVTKLNAHQESLLLHNHVVNSAGVQINLGVQIAVIEPADLYAPNEGPLISWIRKSNITVSTGFSITSQHIIDPSDTSPEAAEQPFVMAEPDISPEDSPDQIRAYLGPSEVIQERYNLELRPYLIAAREMLRAQASSIASSASTTRTLKPMTGWTSPSITRYYQSNLTFSSIAAVKSVFPSAPDEWDFQSGAGGLTNVSMGISFAFLNIDTLNDLTRTFPFGSHGKLLVFDANGLAVVSSEVPTVLERNDMLSTSTPTPIGTPPVRQEMAQYISQLRRWGLVVSEGSYPVTPANASVFLARQPDKALRTKTFSAKEQGWSYHARMLDRRLTNDLPYTVLLVTKDSDFSSQVDENIRDTVILSACVIIIALLLSLFVSHCTTAPLRRTIFWMDRAVLLMSEDTGRGTAEHRQKLVDLYHEYNQHEELTSPEPRVVPSTRGNSPTTTAAAATAAKQNALNPVITVVPVGTGNGNVAVVQSAQSASRSSEEASLLGLSGPPATTAAPNDPWYNPRRLCSKIDFASRMHEVRSLRRTFRSMLLSLTSYDQLEALNKSKRQFIRYIFHEVRVPFNAIVLGIEQLHIQQKSIVQFHSTHATIPHGSHGGPTNIADDDKDFEPDSTLQVGLSPEQWHTMEILEILAEQSQVVSRILNDVLSMQKIEDGALELTYDQFRLESLLRNCLNTFRSACLDKRIRLRIRFDKMNSAIGAHLPGLLLGVKRDRLGVIWTENAITAEQERRKTFASVILTSRRHRESAGGAGRGGGPRLSGRFHERDRGGGSFGGGAVLSSSHHPFDPSQSGRSSGESITHGHHRVMAETLGASASFPPLSLLHNQVYVRGDSYRLRQVLANLTSNAIKFSPNKSIVRVSLEVKNFTPDPLALQAFGPQVMEAVRVVEQTRPVSNETAGRRLGPSADEQEQEEQQRQHRKCSSGGASERKGSAGDETSPSLLFGAPGGAGGVSASLTDFAGSVPHPLASMFADASQSAMLPQKLGVALVRIGVKDHGPGLSPEEMASLFQEYVQIRPNAVQKGGGTGLGLSISKSIIQLHGGTIGVRGNSAANCAAASSPDPDVVPVLVLPSSTPPAPAAGLLSPFPNSSPGDLSQSPGIMLFSPNVGPPSAVAAIPAFPSPTLPNPYASRTGVESVAPPDCTLITGSATSAASSSVGNAVSGSSVNEKGCEFWFELPLEVCWRQDEWSQPPIDAESENQSTLNNGNRSSSDRAHPKIQSASSPRQEEQTHDHAKERGSGGLFGVSQAGTSSNGGGGVMAITASSDDSTGSDSMLTGRDHRLAALPRAPRDAGSSARSATHSVQPSAEQARRQLELAASSTTSTSAPGQGESPPRVVGRARHKLSHSRQLSISMEHVERMLKSDGGSPDEGDHPPTSGGGRSGGGLRIESLSRHSARGVPLPLDEHRYTESQRCSTSTGPNSQRSSGNTPRSSRLLVPTAGGPQHSTRSSPQSFMRPLNSSGWDLSISGHGGVAAEDLPRSLLNLERTSSSGTMEPLRHAGSMSAQSGAALMQPWSSSSSSSSIALSSMPLHGYHLSDGGGGGSGADMHLSHHTSHSGPVTTRTLMAGSARASHTGRTSLIRPGTRVLVVEDSPPNRKLLLSLLVLLKCKATGCENGQECLDLFPEGVSAPTSPAVTAEGVDGQQRLLQHHPQPTMPFDVILMDGTMPVMNGVDATRILRGRGISIPIIAVTGNALLEDCEAFLSVGANEVLTKPVSRAKLEAAISKYCGGATTTTAPAATPATHGTSSSSSSRGTGGASGLGSADSRAASTASLTSHPVTRSHPSGPHAS